mmetsp:Transcript_66538/g.192113  ORF Transcript_66538/g.192113 Transcript_66538/m.192113 type:complete len:201 (-) Transcript_66538:280-882(-)
MFYAMVDEPPSIILLLVQPHHKINAGIAKDGHVVFRRERREPVGVCRCGARAGEGEEALRDDPIHVPVLDLLEMLIEFGVETGVIEPPVRDRKLQALQAIQDGALERANPARGISERQERRVNPTECLVRELCGLAEQDHLVRADQHRRIGPLLGVVRAIVDNALVPHHGVGQLALQGLGVPVDHREIQGAEIREEGLVD